MIEAIFVLVLVAVAGFIIKERYEEKLEIEFFDRAMEVYEAEKDEMEEFEWHEGLEWYDWVELSTCDICDEFMAEGEALLRIIDETNLPIGEGEMVTLEVMTLCEYCLNPDLKDE